MMRATMVVRKIAPFSQFVKESYAASAGKLSMKTIAARYSALGAPQRAALEKRARSAYNPWGKLYAQFMAKQKRAFLGLPAPERQSKINAMWRAERKAIEASKRKAPKKTAAKAAAPKKAAASKKVKKIAKASKM